MLELLILFAAVCIAVVYVTYVLARDGRHQR